MVIKMKASGHYNSLMMRLDLTEANHILKIIMLMIICFTNDNDDYHHICYTNDYHDYDYMFYQW